jgi:3-oxoacyl-[acyl-carrier protein] reductase
MTRTVVVTGGGTGIGRAVAIRFAAAGDDVYVTGRRPEPLAETVALASKTDTAGFVQAVVCDSASPEQLRALVSQLPERVDVLVNNAGGNTDFDAPDDEGLEALADAWRTNFQANVLTAVLTTEALAPKLADNGAVVSHGSIAATKVGRPGTPDDVAETIFFLASPGARHVSAQLVNVNGGAQPTR